MDRLSLALFSRAAMGLARTFELENSIARAGLDAYPQLYAARLLFYTFTSLFAALLIVALVIPTPLPLPLKIALAVPAAMTPVIVFAVGLTYPSIKASSRENGVNSELPFFAAYLTTMAYGGVPPERIIEKVAGLRIFKAIREEARRILRDIKVFGLDPLSAIERNAYQHPSRRYREFMLGYVTTVRTGGDVLHYLELRTQDLFRERAQELSSVAERISMIVEAYITLAVVMTLVLYIFFIVSAILPTGGFGGVQGIVLYSYLGMPLLTVVMLVVIDSVQPKAPIYHREPYAMLAISLPIGVIAGFILFAILGGTEMFTRGEITLKHIVATSISMMIGLSIVNAGPVYSYMRIVRQERRIHHAVANFLRDLTEVRKTGLSPERSIILLSDRDYGVLTPVIRRIAGALSLGLYIERAVRRAVRGYRDWLMLASLRFLIDAIEVGGGTPQTLDALARYSHALAELTDELKRRLRPFIAMPYFGAILIVVTSILVITMLIQSIGAITGALGGGAATIGGLRLAITKHDVAFLLLTTITGSIINAWFMGLVAGKIQELTTAAGFIHSTLLVIVTTITAVALTIATAAPIL